MPRIAIFNMFFGFLLLSVSGAAGSFIANDITEIYLKDPNALHSWQLTLSRSAHGHTNLFGLIHIALGLSFPYTRSNQRIKWLQTLGLTMGSLTMAMLMLIRAYLGPPSGVDALGYLIGIGLGAALMALFSHSYFLAQRLFEKA